MARTQSRFDLSLALVLRHEGGFVRHPRDPGGATNLGITRQTLSRARGRSASVDDVRHLTQEEAASIYRRFYWDAVLADELPPGLDLAVFDFAVHSGPAKAARTLQGLLGVQADGVVGPVTLEAARQADAGDAIRRLTRARLGFLSRLGVWPVFGRGWRRRVLSVEQEALRLASIPHPSQGALPCSKPRPFWPAARSGPTSSGSQPLSSACSASTPPPSPREPSRRRSFS
ncbi:glycoside hydrolase family 108 protein [Microvirga aerilata]|uniref:Glycoside hydrolase family 108 protein n=1 Tax=Microvirga aerilata TaxID=670292 RepID=A0A937CY03_9HYPH|nr:glycoside hydrolase family 108 protein [Microvirga aerilata]